MGFIINIHTGLNVMKALRRSTPNGWEKNQPFQLSFNASLKIDFRDRVSTTAGEDPWPVGQALSLIHI